MKTKHFHTYHEAEAPVAAYATVLAVLMFFVVALALALWQPWAPPSTTRTTTVEFLRPNPIPTPLGRTVAYRPEAVSTIEPKTKIVGAEENEYADDNGMAALGDDASESVDIAQNRSAVVKPSK